jgi:hypothetical protein
MKHAILVWALLTLTACNDATPPQTEAARQKEEKQPSVLDDQLKAIDKANAVEGQLMQDKEDADKALEQQGG